jgi:hypothetical protein
MTASTENVSVVSLAEPATLPELQPPLPPPGLAAKPKRVRAKAAPRVKVQAAAPEVLPPPPEPPAEVPAEVPEPPAPEKKKRAPRPAKVQTSRPPVEIIEPEEEERPPPEPQYSNEYVLEHLLNHRVRQRVQREAMYKSFVGLF